MEIVISKDSKEMGQKAAELAASQIQAAISQRGGANVILATGASQFDVLSSLVESDIDWTKVTMFHLDEYIDLPVEHDASFRKYLTERFLEKIDFACQYHLIDGNADPATECRRVGDLIVAHPIDVALIGIGENGHLAFNDPPADFETEEPYLVVNLDDACRQQQFGEGWFESLDKVPSQAISMSIRQILKSSLLIVSVPDERKAKAVKEAIEGPLTNMCPASILRTHNNCQLLLDRAAASLL